MNIKRNIIFSLENRKRDGVPIVDNVPIRMRVTYARHRIEFTTGYRIDASKWDAERQRVRNGCSNKLKQTAAEINADLNAYSKLKRDSKLPDDFNLVQCLFGEHLLKRYPDKVVALVESEKSALIGAGCYPDYVWLTTGGRSQLSIDKLRVLRNRTVIMFSDVDGYGLWCEKAKELEAIGCQVMVSDMLEKNSTTADREAKIDLADWLIRQLHKQHGTPTLHQRL